MEHKVVAPAVGESITEVRIIEWQRKDGEAVKAGDVLLEIETDKASVEVAAPHSGVLKILKGADETINVGATIGIIDDAAKPTVQSSQTSNSVSKNAVTSTSTSSTPIPATSTNGGQRVLKEELLEQIKNLGGQMSPAKSTSTAKPTSTTDKSHTEEELSHLLPGETKEKMTRLRLKIAENLVKAQRTAAILTTFNEVDLTAVMDLRQKHKESFKKKHGVSLGFMSFFTRACCLSLLEQPLVNGSIEGEYLIKRSFVNMGVAVGTDRGLVVPVLKDAHKMTFADIEKTIVEMATKAKDGKLSINDMSNGTFTISNGGVYGSMLSTPILNAPQSGILGMHNIMQRPVAVNGKVEIRPMMYLALSYDHRIIDGKEAVTFLVSVKRRLENPQELGLDFI